jgi:hypothetical protein
MFPTQDFVFAKRVIYGLRHTSPIHFAFVILEVGHFVNYSPRLAPKHDQSDFSLPSS